MKQKIKKIIVGIILITVLNLAAIAQTSGTWTQILPSGSGVNDVAVGWGRNDVTGELLDVIFITKTDGTIWRKDFNQSNFTQIGFPQDESAIRITASSADDVWVTSVNRNSRNQGLFNKSGNSWLRINPNNLGNFNINDLFTWVSALVIAQNSGSQHGVHLRNWITGDFFQYTARSLYAVGPINITRISGYHTGFLLAIDSNGSVWNFSDFENAWKLTSATGMGDITTSRNKRFRFRVWVAGKEFVGGQRNGTIWYSDDDGVTWVKDPVAQGFQNIAARAAGADDTLYAAGFNGSLWKRHP